jgi:hypothetical protein
MSIGSDPLYSSKEFGQTPPPSDGRIAPCPTCVKGQQLIDHIHIIGCPDCFGSGIQGYGFTALMIFNEWIDGLGSDGDDD